MWTRVSLWVMAPSRADRLDGRDGWVFTLCDAHEQPFSWKGIDYSGGLPAIAPSYLDVELPPGTYVAWATRGADSTHRAVVAVHDEQVVVVRLLPETPADGGSGDGGQGGSKDCEITVDHVRGENAHDGYPGTLVVSGSASNCSQVDIDLSRQGITGHEHGSATVAADDTWSHAFPNALKSRCGASVTVTATCTADRRCATTRTLPVECG